MKLLIVNNLDAGYREGAIYDFIRAFSNDGDEVCIRSTDGTTDIRPFLFDAHTYDCVVASGGDGTVAAVSYQLSGSGIPVLPFPAGTANLLCSNLGLPNETHALAAAVRDMKTMDFDIVEIEMAGTRAGFNIMAGAGYDATIMSNAQPHKKLLGPMAYFTAAVANVSPQVSHFTLRLDNEVIESEGVGVLLVNFAKIQFDLAITHGSDSRDGLMEVVILKTENALGLLPALGAALLDREGNFPSRTHALEIHQAKTVSIIADPALKTQFDGEPIEETTPLSAKVLHRAARFVVTDEAFKLYSSSSEAL